MGLMTYSLSWQNTPTRDDIFHHTNLPHYPILWQLVMD